MNVLVVKHNTASVIPRIVSCALLCRRRWPVYQTSVDELVACGKGSGKKVGYPITKRKSNKDLAET